MPREYDKERMERLALYIASRSSNDPKFGKTKLAKILFYSDFAAYRETGEPITGASYSKLPNGPVPLAMYSAIKRVVKCGKGVISEDNYYGKAQMRLVATEPVGISIFTSEEISLVEQAIEALRDEDASGVSALSHTEPAWQYVGDMEPIPYELAWVSASPPSDESLRIGQGVAARLGVLTRSGALLVVK